MPDPLDRGTGPDDSGDSLIAPMPGRVRAVDARPGQTAARGDRLLVLEAMKMEHSLVAARDGTITEVLVQVGDQVEAGMALILLESTG